MFHLPFMSSAKNQVFSPRTIMEHQGFEGDPQFITGMSWEKSIQFAKACRNCTDVAKMTSCACEGVKHTTSKSQG